SYWDFKKTLHMTGRWLALLTYQGYNIFTGYKNKHSHNPENDTSPIKTLKGKTMQFTQDELSALLKNPKPLNLAGCDLSKADLSGADLSGAYLNAAKLRYADLSRANLSDTNLSGANLHGATLSEADLSDANLSKTDLSGAKLTNAHLNYVDLADANLSGVDLNGAKYNKETKWPDGFDAEAAGAILES
ncbi:MAG: pentapeptide repeat-containing protein, partial [Anaerolineales bacterium]|nr:pentapeptide repeat-containing protein [Anaerolineales bacterium]